MLEKIHVFLSGFPLQSKWIYSLFLIVGLVVLRSVLLRLHFRSHQNWAVEDKRHLLVASRNFTVLGIVLGLFMIWATQIQAFALSMVALAAATVLATKELIMCLSGSLLRMITKQYSVGDYIEVNHIRGKVIDINMFSTLVMEVGPNALVEQLAGKSVSFPNSLLLSVPVKKDNILERHAVHSILERYVVHSFEIPVPIHLDSDAIVPPLSELLQKECAPYVEEVQQHLIELQVQKLFITPAAHHRISRVPFDDKVYKLVIRFAAPVGKRVDIQQNVLDEFIRIQYRLLNNQ